MGLWIFARLANNGSRKFKTKSKQKESFFNGGVYPVCGDLFAENSLGRIIVVLNNCWFVFSFNQ